MATGRACAPRDPVMNERTPHDSSEQTQHDSCQGEDSDHSNDADNEDNDEKTDEDFEHSRANDMTSAIHLLQNACESVNGPGGFDRSDCNTSTDDKSGDREMLDAEDSTRTENRAGNEVSHRETGAAMVTAPTRATAMTAPSGTRTLKRRGGPIGPDSGTATRKSEDDRKRRQISAP